MTFDRDLSLSDEDMQTRFWPFLAKDFFVYGVGTFALAATNVALFSWAEIKPKL